MSRFFSAFFIIALLDQISKFLFFQLGIHSINTGISFSFFSENSAGQQVLLIVFMLIFLGIIILQFWKKFPFFVGLIAGGAVSNVLDRLFFGGVRDFLPVPIITVQNNLADWGIFIGLMGIFWKEWRSREIGKLSGIV